MRLVTAGSDPCCRPVRSAGTPGREQRIWFVGLGTWFLRSRAAVTKASSVELARVVVYHSRR